MKIAKFVLFAGGAALIAIGALSIFENLTLMQILGLLVWLGAAIVVHDAVLVPALTIAGTVFRRAGRRLPVILVVVAEAAFAAGALLTAVVLPELIAQQRGPSNPSVLPGDYATRLGFVWLAIILVVAAFAVITVRRGRKPADRA